VPAKLRAGLGWGRKDGHRERGIEKKISRLSCGSGKEQ
jgi:hypothetical protein